MQRINQEAATREDWAMLMALWLTKGNKTLAQEIWNDFMECDTLFNDQTNVVVGMEWDHDYTVTKMEIRV
jgi:hypothetical protein